MFNFKLVIDNKIHNALHDLGHELTEKYKNKDVFVYFGVDQNRISVSKKKLKVKEIKIIENDNRFETIYKFADLVYVAVLIDSDDNEIWLNSVDFY